MERWILQHAYEAISMHLLLLLFLMQVFFFEQTVNKLQVTN